MRKNQNFAKLFKSPKVFIVSREIAKNQFFLPLQKDNDNNIYFNYSEISLGKSIKELIDNGIPLEVIERHSEYEPLSEKHIY